MFADVNQLKFLTTDEGMHKLSTFAFIVFNTLFNVFRDDPRMKCLIALSKCEMGSIREVARFAGISPTTASFCLKKLENLQIIERVNLNSNKTMTYKFSRNFENLKQFLERI